MGRGQTGVRKESWAGQLGQRFPKNVAQAGPWAIILDILQGRFLEESGVQEGEKGDPRRSKKAGAGRSRCWPACSSMGGVCVRICCIVVTHLNIMLWW